MKRTTLLLLILAVGFNCKKDPPVVPPNGGPDTTGHNWTFTTEVIGEFGSYLRDVALLEDGTAWAVGQIWLRDSSGQIEPQAYNVARWNGQGWSFSRATNVVLNAVFAFSANDAWAGSSAPYHWNGQQWVGFNVSSVFNGTINKIWGVSSSRMFIVGTNGAVALFNGSTWQRLESNTTVDLLDVWGSPDGSVVWACGYKDFVGTVLLKITGTTVEKVYDDLDTWFRIRQDSLSGVLTSVWTDQADRVYLSSSSGVYVCSAHTQGEGTRIWYDDTHAPGLPRRMRGIKSNDLLACGEFGSIYHFNGSTWKYYEKGASSSIRWWSLGIHQNHALVAGAENQTRRAVIMHARRDQVL